MYAPHNSFRTFKMPVCSFGEGTHPDEARRVERYIGTHPDEAQRDRAEFLRRNLVTTFRFFNNIPLRLTVKLWCITFATEIGCAGCYRNRMCCRATVSEVACADKCATCPGSLLFYSILTRENNRSMQTARPGPRAATTPQTLTSS